MRILFDDSKDSEIYLELILSETNESAESILLRIYDSGKKLGVRLEAEDALKLAQVLMAWCNEDDGFKLLSTYPYKGNG